MVAKKDSSRRTIDFPTERLRRLFAKRHTVCIVGRALSFEARAPDFADILDGVWSQGPGISKCDPFCSSDGYRVVMDWCLGRRRMIEELTDSSVFATLKRLQDSVGLSVASQCVDGLMRRNGIDGHELYGNVFEVRCQTNGHEFASWPDSMSSEERAGCPICGSTLFPNVSMFGWNRRAKEHGDVVSRLQGCELLVRIGADANLEPITNPVFKARVVPILDIERNTLLFHESDCTSSLAANEVASLLGSNDSLGARSFSKVMDGLSALFVQI